METHSSWTRDCSQKNSKVQNLFLSAALKCINLTFLAEVHSFSPGIPLSARKTHNSYSTFLIHLQHIAHLVHWINEDFSKKNSPPQLIFYNIQALITKYEGNLVASGNKTLKVFLQ